MRARTRFLLDLVIACGLIAAYQPGWTGISLHEWVSIAIIVPLAVHLVVNWEWCVRIARTFMDRLFHASRANFFVDVALLVASVAVMLSGIMVSEIPSWFGGTVALRLVWTALHAWSANAIIALFAVHALLHRTWIVSTAKRLVPVPGALARGPAGAPARVAAPARINAVARAGGMTPAQSRRSTRLAAEKAAGRRKAGAVGVATVTLALGSLIFASVAVAGPALSRSLGLHGTAFTVAATTANAASAVTRTRTTRRSATAQDPAAQTAPVASTPATPASATLVCPRTGCAAATCHGTAGVSASVWYKTHQ
jgi:hypothetical protein